MRRVYTSLLVATLGVLLGACATNKQQTSSANRQEVITITKVATEQQPFAKGITPLPEGATAATVRVNGKEVASQIVRSELLLSNPTTPLCVAYQYEAKRGKNRVEITPHGGTQTHYEPQVHAQMYYKNRDKTLRKIEFVEEGADTMYNRLHHHGPAFENRYVAYRLYFDKKQTVDLYGKRTPQLEIAKTMWYPTDQHIAEGSGDDVLRVSGSVGVGTLKGWDAKKKKAVHITPFERREARVLASGPILTIVSMSVEGWEYCGRKVDIHSVYTLWSEDRHCRVRHTFAGDYQGLQFCTGVQKVGPKADDHRKHITDRAIAQWGTYWPQNDTVKYKMESVGLVVWPKDGQADNYERVEDKQNYLCLLAPDQNGILEYTFSFVWLEEQWADWSPEEFFSYVDNHQPEGSPLSH